MRVQNGTKWTKFGQKLSFRNLPMGFFLFFEIRVLSAFFSKKKRVFSAQEGILFFTTSPEDRTNRPKWTKFGQKLSFRNLPMSFFLFFEIRPLSAFFFEKTRFFGSGRHTVFLPPRLETAPIDQNGPNLDKNCLLGISRMVFFC